MKEFHPYELVMGEMAADEDDDEEDEEEDAEEEEGPTTPTPVPIERNAEAAAPEEDELEDDEDEDEDEDDETEESEAEDEEEEEASRALGDELGQLEDADEAAERVDWVMVGVVGVGSALNETGAVRGAGVPCCCTTTVGMTRGCT
jgi:hypothetical protein